MALQEKREALCLEQGDRSSLAYCHWNWPLLAREQRYRKTAGKAGPALILSPS